MTKTLVATPDPEPQPRTGYTLSSSTMSTSWSSGWSTWTLVYYTNI